MPASEVNLVVHIYTAEKQPLTEFMDDNFDKPIRIRNEPTRHFICHACRRCKEARHLSIQVYYDGWNICCTEKEYGRSPEFPFGYTQVCVGSSFKPRHSDRRDLEMAEQHMRSI